VVDMNIIIRHELGKGEHKTYKGEHKTYKGEHITYKGSLAVLGLEAGPAC